MVEQSSSSSPTTCAPAPPPTFRWKAPSAIRSKVTTAGLDHTLESAASAPSTSRTWPTTSRPKAAPWPASKSTWAAAPSRPPKGHAERRPEFPVQAAGFRRPGPRIPDHMQPIQQDGAWYMLSGMRFALRPVPLHAHPDGRRRQAGQLVHDPPPAARQIPPRRTRLALCRHRRGPDGRPVRSRMEETTRKTLELFAIGGFETSASSSRAPSPKPSATRPPTSSSRSSKAPPGKPGSWPRAEAGLPAITLDGAAARLVRDTLNATSDSLHYGAPVFFQLAGFDEVRHRAAGHPLAGQSRSFTSARCCWCWRVRDALHPRTSALRADQRLRARRSSPSAPTASRWTWKNPSGAIGTASPPPSNPQHRPDRPHRFHEAHSWTLPTPTTAPCSAA